MSTGVAVSIVGVLVLVGVIAAVLLLNSGSGDRIANNAQAIAALGPAAPAITSMIRTAENATGVQNTINNVANTISTVSGTINTVLSAAERIRAYWP